MVDEAKLAKAADTLKGQGQQDEPTTPADLAIKGAEKPGGRADAPKERSDARRREPPA